MQESEDEKPSQKKADTKTAIKESSSDSSESEESESEDEKETPKKKVRAMVSYSLISFRKCYNSYIGFFLFADRISTLLL